MTSGLGCLTADDVAGYVDPERSVDRGTIAEHIDRCEACRQVVAGAVRAARGGKRPSARDDDGDPGDRVDRYAVFEPLGVGGMGVVYKAYDPRLDRKVALKLLRASLCDERNRERMQNEARMLAKLAHPNVVAVHDAGTWHDRVYIAMELVDGVTLRDWLIAKPRAWTEIVDVLIQAGDGLASAHAAGLVHRDFKPQNVLVGRDGRARVSDFGLAAAGPTTDGEPAVAAIADASSTTTGSVAGTPAYMSPEHFTGGKVDAGSDQFSFCVTAYEALFGERPFTAATFGELRDAVATGRVAEPTRGRVPRRIARCVLRGLSADRSARYPDMRALVTALRGGRARSHRVAIASVGAVAVLGIAGWQWARPAGAPTPEQRCDQAAAAAGEALWSEPRRIALSAALGASGLEYAIDLQRTASARLADYAASWRAQYDEACRATRVSGTQTEAMLDLRMACLDEKRRHVDALVARLVHVGRAELAAVPDALAAIPDVQACSDLATLQSGGPQPTRGPLAKKYDELADELAAINVSRDLGELETALAQVARAEPAVTELGNKSLQAKFRYIHGELLDHAGRAAEAAPLLEDAVYASEAARDQETKISALVRLYMIAGNRLDKPAAERWSRLAEAAVSAGPASDPLRSYLLLAQGMYAYQTDDMPTAATKFEQALVLARQEPDSVQLMGLLTNLASVYFMQERDAEAKKLWDEALAYARKHYGPRHPDLGLVLGNLALFESTTGDLTSAIAHYAEALAIAESALGRQHPRVGKTHLRLAESLAADPAHAPEAAAHFRIAVDGLAAAYPNGHPDVIEALLGYAMYAQHTHDLRTALALYERARAGQEKLTGPDDPSLFKVLHGLGSAHLELHEAKVALSLLQRARALRLRSPQASPESLARIDEDLARAIADARAQ